MDKTKTTAGEGKQGMWARNGEQEIEPMFLIRQNRCARIRKLQECGLSLAGSSVCRSMAALHIWALEQTALTQLNKTVTTVYDQLKLNHTFVAMTTHADLTYEIYDWNSGCVCVLVAWCVLALCTKGVTDNKALSSEKECRNGFVSSSRGPPVWGYS